MATVTLMAARSRLRVDREALMAVGAIGLALALRVGFVIYSHRTYVPVYDAADFNRIARSLAAGHGFGPTVLPGAHGASAFRTPLYPAVLGAAYAVFGYHVMVGRLVTALISTAAVASIGLLAWRVGGRRLGLVALYLAAVYPSLILAGYGLNYEVLFVTLECLALVAALEWVRHPSRGWLLVACGLLIGLATLCRETALLLLVPSAIMALGAYHTLSLPRALKSLSVVLLSAAVVIAPWTIRNALTLHAFVPVSDSPGVALAGEYNATTLADKAHIARWIVPTSDPTDARRVLAIGPSATEVQETASLQKAGTAYLEAHPSSVFQVVAGNTVRIFALRGFGDATFDAPYIGWSSRFTKVSVLGFWLVGAVALVGLFTRRARAVPRAMWAFPVLLYLTLALTVGIDQYRAPLEPFFIVLAAAAVVTAHNRWAGRMANRSPK